MMHISECLAPIIVVDHGYHYFLWFVRLLKEYCGLNLFNSREIRNINRKCVLANKVPYSRYNNFS